MIKRLFTFLFFLTLSQYALAQCAENLNEARDAFDAGQLELVSGFLNECLSKSGTDGFTSEQKIEAYRLLTITYLYLEDPFGAEQSFLKLLEEDPEYRILSTDPIELEYLSRRFISTPIISYTAKIGTNASTATVLHYNTMSAEGNMPNYSVGPGVQLGGSMELHFNKMIGLNIEVLASYRTLKKEMRYFQDVDWMDVNSTRDFIFASMPITLRYTYPGITYYPYVYGGYSPAVTISPSYEFLRDPKQEVKKKQSGVIRSETNVFSHSLVFGAGIKRRFGYKYVLVDLRYNLGMTNMVNAKNALSFENDINSIKVFSGLDPEDDYRWNSFELSFGFVWPIYNPREKNTVTIQTVVKRWFSKKDKKDE